MWMFVIGACFVEPNPSAFDWLIDRTFVAGISVFPAEADWTVPRTVDALVLSPYRIEEVRTELCGLRTDEPVELGFDSVGCFGEPALLTPIPGPHPTIWTPPELAFECPEITVSEGVIEETVHVGDSGTPIQPGCGSLVPVRVHARSTDDEASSAAMVTVFTEPYDPRVFLPDPATADPRLEVVDGTVAAGSTVLLRFSMLTGFSDGYHWYTSAGVFHGTGRTAFAGTDGDRTYGENRLEIPAGFHGPLTLATVAGGTSWAVITVEVP